jgi:transcriptional regulator with XRE-family HTH domain
MMTSASSNRAQREVVEMSMAGRMVRHARRRAGLTQRGLAARSSIPQETIARIERGRTDPRLGTVQRLLEACGFGLESWPSLGVGVDRSQIRALLDLEPAARLAWAFESDQTYVEMRASLRRVAE